MSSSSSSLLSRLELSDTKVYEPWIRALLGTVSHFCEVLVLKLRNVLMTNVIRMGPLFFGNPRSKIVGHNPNPESYSVVMQNGLSWISHTGVPRSSATAFSWEPTAGLCLGPYGGPKGGVFFPRSKYPCTTPECRQFWVIFFSATCGASKCWNLCLAEQIDLWQPLLSFWRGTLVVWTKISHMINTILLLIGCRKSIPTKKCQLIVYYYLLRSEVDGFAGELTYKNQLIDTLCQIKMPIISFSHSRRTTVYCQRGVKKLH